MNEGIPHGGRTCGAKTRAGGACRRAITRRGGIFFAGGRCHLHGGYSPVGVRHPNFKHGRYSKYSFERFGELRARHERKRARIMGPVYRRLEAWIEARGGVYSVRGVLGALRRFEREHLESLAERRAAYAKRARLPASVLR